MVTGDIPLEGNPVIMSRVGRGEGGSKLLRVVRVMHNI